MEKYFELRQLVALVVVVVGLVMLQVQVLVQVVASAFEADASLVVQERVQELTCQRCFEATEVQ